MFHPAMANKFSGPGLNVHATYNRDPEKNKANPVEGELSSPFEEDSKDIDALLSLEGEEVEDHDEEELSIARTDKSYEVSVILAPFMAQNLRRGLHHLFGSLLRPMVTAATLKLNNGK